MASFLSILPWALFGVMVLFAIMFAVVAWMSTRRASSAADREGLASHALREVEERAVAAEQQIERAHQETRAAEQRAADAEARALHAEDAARAAERRAEDYAAAARQAAANADQADAQLRRRRDAAAEKVKKSELRARALLDWARQQWESRREADRQKAQSVQASFQQQLDAYLDHRRKPITFRVEGEIDEMAAPLIVQYAPAEQRVQLDGDLVRVTFPVDPAQGFRA